MNVSTKPNPEIVSTPRGLARICWRSGNIVGVRFCDTGSPWTFEARQITAVQL